MSRFALSLAIAIAPCFFLAGSLLAQEAATQPPVAEPPVTEPANPPAPQPPATPVQLVEATKEEIWTLGGQQWDFKEIATTYKPVKGAMNPQTGVVQWTLEIVRDMTEGEIGMHENLEETPFKPAFLDAERIVLESDAPARMSKIAGKAGDRIMLGVKLPPPEVLEKVTLIRVGKRTNVGF